MTDTLDDQPDWIYMLREFKELYRGNAGGSTKIRAHQRAVREAINRLMGANPKIQINTLKNKPITTHLKIAEIADRAMKRLRRRLKVDS